MPIRSSIQPLALLIIAQATSSSSASPTHRQAAWWMFILVAGLLVLFFSVVAIVAASRAIRRGQHATEGKRTSHADASSPWEEAGRRAKAPDDDDEYRDRST